MFRKDIKEICKSLDYSYKNSYERLKNEMQSKLNFLKENPYLYQYLDDNKTKRRFFIQKYIVIYNVKKDRIKILRILFQKSNYYKKIYIKSKKQKSLK